MQQILNLKGKLMVSSSKEMGFLNPNYPPSGESEGAVQLGRDVTATTLVQIKLVGLSN